MTINIGDYIQKPTYGIGDISKYGGVYGLKLLAGYYEIVKINDNRIKARFIGSGRQCIRGKYNIWYYPELKTQHPDMEIEIMRD